MTNDARSLRGILEELHAALQESPDIGDEGRAALLRAAGEIEEALEATGDGGSSTIREQLNQSIAQFEQSHPKLTSIVGRIADALSDLGI